VAEDPLDSTDEPSSPQGLPQGLPAQNVAEDPLDSTEEPSSPQGLPQGLSAQNVAEDEPSDSDVASKRYANKLRRELREGKTSRDQPLSEEQAQSHIAKLHRRMLVLPARYRQAGCLCAGVCPQVLPKSYPGGPPYIQDV
jgi:hypothetical protein